ncbi:MULTISPECIES: glycosyltransferase family 4 protein [Acidithiobacillus]|uniref:Mannosyltransferase n=2 Tax=Acidithiobacillus ferrooxidans TaxID=920 RepID=B7J3I2_ACIF2|nr:MULTISPECIES: glycosyltransferase family 1 protein [Acidithiobacillus]MCL4527325.1 glycosyltransferase family 4 protein [Gammaproteobacteria bacterium]ACH82346.1 glycosyl transferase group 1 [Acidithiobacillus ferrooxidans ATCC 53993]ACK80649.1 mannosyltransferase [Acidithiobacillus ferrooxidans ATCC 23270]MBN6745165.1 glycosyltransferase family 4 protein [Acidithiobacillus sp. MC2.2]MBN6748357.1 glycosyltransferase family 4 protein [Acidithiobacillus sp. PG05]
MFYVNSRILGQSITGVQRYLLELLQRMPAGGIQQIAPRHPISGARAHLWEQAVLPLRTRGHLLWSPSNTGPLAVSRQVVTIHDVVPIDHPEWLNPRFSAWYRFLTPKLARRVARVITDSEFTKARLLETTGVADNKVTVVPLGVDARFGPQDGDDVESAIQKLELPTSRYVLSLGSLEPRKNLGRLLRAWAIIYRRLPEDVWLVVSGAKGKSLVFQDVPELKALPPRVFLTGHVPDELLPSLYAGAIAFAYLSVYEGFGLPPLEAMASGTPTLVGNCASLPEVVGDAAVQVDPYDIDAIADGLQRLIEDASLRAVLREKGLERAGQFKWDKTAEQTWRVLAEAAED